MSQLAVAIAILSKTFNDYARKEGKKDMLNKGEVKTLLEKELPGLLQEAKNPGEVDKLIKSLDLDGDSEVNFTEFMALVVRLACAIHFFKI
ncbi:protein S100-P-like [Parambassis ranga]|uniref:Protein S100-P-like n=1 Tax=Parambassis ranga TaxID=210632 RepID=A0A6P7K831_9TELE|nr:protein S100-P-like [Parambassis ranga]XP_028284743.1 protein S100-P-like [Parambassis ranga]XP_028285516.1 protein S100-P-like [Parambassis ranga]XP_028285517.1 protein S100-P-like [Parambassis ranga]